MKTILLYARLLFIISVMVVSSLACGFISTSNITTLPDIPTIKAFYASPTKITEGSPAILIWDVSNAGSMQIDQGIGAVFAMDGSKLVTPGSDTTYTLTATNSAGSVSQSVTIKVALLPDIVVFEISPNILHWSKYTAESAVMRWEVLNATTAKITESVDDGIPDLTSIHGLNSMPGYTARPIEHSGSRSIHLSPEVIFSPGTERISLPYGITIPSQTPISRKPLGTHIYTLEATNANGTVTKIQTLEAVP